MKSRTDITEDPNRTTKFLLVLFDSGKVFELDVFLIYEKKHILSK